MSEKDFEISRRKALAGIGVVGVASAGAGLGTTAYFSDQEEFDNNTIMAGEFGLTVDPYNYEVNQDGQSQDISWGENKGEFDEGAFVGGSIGIGDAKPGDDFKFCWEITIHDNPGYVMVNADKVVDNNGQEAENVDPGDLHDLPETGLTTLGEAATAKVRVYSSTGNDLSTVKYESLNELLDSLEGGLNVAGDGKNPLEIGPDQKYSTVRVCVYISISTDVGNEIQGAETSANLEFYAEQSRHNDWD